MARSPIVRNRCDARVHDPHKPALVEVPGKWVGAVVKLTEAFRQGRLGKTIKALQALSKSEASSGVLVAAIGPNSQAAKAGMARGDLLLRYDGVQLEKAKTLTSLTRRTDASKAVTIDAIRGAEKLHFKVHGGWLGMRVETLSLVPPAVH
jgi:S1-C subfamily serine protease